MTTREALVRKIFLTATFLLLATLADAQEASLEGEVLSAVGEARLGEAKITLYRGIDVVHKTLTDQRGSFAVSLIVPGDYRITVSLDGFHEVERVLTLGPRQLMNVIVDLQPRSLVVEEVNVTSLGVIDVQSTSSSRVLTRSTLDALNAPMTLDIPTMAEYQIPGAIIGHDNFVHVRGNELSLHQFINGVSFLDNSHRQFTPAFSPRIFETVNIISGGFPAEFGNRYGGIFDVTTRSGNSVEGGSATLGLGSVESRDGAFDYGNSVGRWGYYVYAGAFHSGRFLNPPEPEEYNATGRSVRTVAQLDYQGDRNLVKLFVSGGDSRFNLPNTLVEDQEGRDAQRELQSVTGILSWRHIVSSRSLLTGSLYARNISDDLLPTSDVHTTLADGARQTRSLGGKLDWFQSIGSHRLKAGVDISGYRLREAFDFDARLPETEEHGAEGEVHHDEHETSDLEHEHHGEEESAHGGELMAFSFSGRQNNKLINAYLQDRLNLTERLFIDLGVRLDHLNMGDSYTEFSPRVGLAYDFPQVGSVVRVAYNRLFSPPPIEYLLLGDFLGNRSDDEHDRVGNVKPYVMQYFEAGLRQHVRNDIVVDIAAYRHDGNHAFETSEIWNTRLFVPTNFADASAKGLEFGLDYRPLERSGISGRVQYALAKVDFVGPVSGGFAVGAHGAGELSPPAFDQRHTLSSSIVYRQPWRSFQVGAIVRYGSGTPSEQHHDGGLASYLYLPDHWNVDINARLNLLAEESRSVDLEFDVTNATDNVYAIAKESESTPLQYAMRRVIAGRLRVSF